jgi:DNA-binding MarR family transcriptional regulator
MPVKIIVDDPVRRPIYILHQVNESLKKLEDKMHREVGITTQKFGVLSALNTLHHPVTPTVIANLMDRNTNTITLMIDRMEKDGLVSRIRDLDDRRSLRLKLEKKGEKAFGQGIERHRVLYKEIMSCLNKDELQELSRLLDKILAKTFEMRQLKESVKEVKVK